MRTLAFLLILALNLTVPTICTDKYNRNDFPARPGFVFGASTSAYQVEGAAFEDGRKASIWDTFAHEGHSGGATGDVALDHYHKYKEDVQLMVETGLEAYRLSISWSRLIPDGRGPVNPKGVQFYNNLINEIISHGIVPHVSLYNYDHPQALEDEYGGWVSPKMPEDFKNYADVCFREFGDRVSYWTTVNEPNIQAVGGYDAGQAPPRRCSAPFGDNCSRGNSSIEPYLAFHHMLLAHGMAARLYKEKYQAKQQGFIGLTLYAFGLTPLTNSTEDLVATKRARDFFIGWAAEPLIFGDYPDTMKKNVGSRLPAFTEQESKMLKGSFDFLGLIHYSTLLIRDDSDSLKLENRDFNSDMAVWTDFDPTSFEVYPIEPSGLRGVLEYFKDVYGNPPLYIHENGQRNYRNVSLEDTSRVEYLHEYIGTVLDQIRNGSDVRGYFVWSLFDVLEVLDGYKTSFGLYYVDVDDPNLTRIPKLSANWYSHFLSGGNVSSEQVIELQRAFSHPASEHASQ